MNSFRLKLNSYCLKEQGENRVDKNIWSTIGHVVKKTYFYKSGKTGFEYSPENAIKCLLVLLGKCDKESPYPLRAIGEKTLHKEKYQDGKSQNIVYTVYKRVSEKKNEPFENGTTSTQCTMLLIIVNKESKCCCLYTVKAIFVKKKLEYITFKCCDFDAFATCVQPKTDRFYLNSGFAVAMAAEAGILKSGASQACLHVSGGCLELMKGNNYDKVSMIHLEHVKAVSKGDDHVLLGGERRFIFKKGHTISLVEERPKEKFVYNPDEDRLKTPV